MQILLFRLFLMFSIPFTIFSMTFTMYLFTENYDIFYLGKLFCLAWLSGFIPFTILMTLYENKIEKK